MKLPISRNSALFAVAASAVFLISAVFLLEETKRTSFHGDESGWISAGYYYADLLFKQDFDWQRWKCDSCGEWGSWLVPNLGKLLIGLPLKVNPQTADKNFFEFFWWDHTYEWNENAGHIPPPDILFPARNASAVFGALICTVIFTIGFLSGNLWIGIIGVLLLLTNQSFVDSATRAMTDVHYDFFLVSLGLPAVLLLKQGSRKRMLLACCLFGGLAGLASSVKESGVVVAGLFFVSVVIYKGIASHLAKKDYFLYLLGFSVSTLVMVYALNPYYWPSWQQINAQALAQEVRTAVDGMTSGKFDAITWKTHYPQLSNLAHILQFPGLFVTRMKYMDNQLATGNAVWNGDRLIILHQNLLVTYASLPLEWVFLGIGVTAGMLGLIRSIRDRTVILSSIAVLYFLTNYVVVLVFMKVNAYRYYIPVITADRILVAVGIYGLIATAVRHWFKRYLHSHTIGQL